MLFPISHYDLDNYYWNKNWKPKIAEEFRNDVKKMVETDGNWIIDGYYDQVKDIVLKHADFVVILDVSLATILCRLVLRSLNRIITRKRVCGDNTESFKFLFSKKGLLLYTIQQKSVLKNVYSELKTEGSEPKFLFFKRGDDLLKKLGKEVEK